MSRRILSERNIRKVSRSTKGTHYITIPVEHIRNLKWRKGQKVVVEQIGKKILIKDWKK